MDRQPDQLVFVSYLLAHSGFQVRSMLEIIRFFFTGRNTPLGHCHDFFMGGIILDHWRFKFDRPIVPNRAPHYIYSFLLVVFMGIGIFDADNLRPVLGKGIGPVLKGIKVTALSFQVLKSF